MTIASQNLPSEIRPSAVRVRHPQASDGAAVWQMIEEIGVLEQNTCYAYVLLCSHFADTCLLAERHGELIGFVAAYRPPSRPDAVFVWQIGIKPAARGMGLAKSLLDQLVEVPACEDVTYLEATVTPSNEASRRLFSGFARHRDVPCHIGPGYAATDFGPTGHEPEELFRIGPLNA